MGAGGTSNGGQANQSDITVVGDSAAAGGIGKESTVIGSQAGGYLNNSCSYNTLIGYRSASGIGTAGTPDLTYSTVIGAECAEFLSSGTSNVIIGVSSALTEVSNGNTYINTPNVPTTGGGNVIVGGYDQNGNTSPVHVFSGAGPDNNNVLIGSSKTTTAYVKVAWTVTSDERDKMVYGSVPSRSGLRHRSASPGLPVQERWPPL